MGHINLVEEQHYRKNQEVDIAAMCWAENYRTFSCCSQLSNLIKLYLIHDNFLVDSLEDVYVGLTHDS